jgi:hypothetical protein
MKDEREREAGEDAVQFSDRVAGSTAARLQNALGALPPGRKSSVLERLAEMPSSYRPMYLKVVLGRASSRVAIKAQCLECVGWERREVVACTAEACPLWAYRPYQS